MVPSSRGVFISLSPVTVRCRQLRPNQVLKGEPTTCFKNMNCLIHKENSLRGHFLFCNGPCKWRTFLTHFLPFCVDPFLEAIFCHQAHFQYYCSAQGEFLLKLNGRGERVSYSLQCVFSFYCKTLIPAEWQEVSLEDTWLLISFSLALSANIFVLESSSYCFILYGTNNQPALQSILIIRIKMNFVIRKYPK